MQGYQVSGIKPGSLVEEMGLGEGDVIVEANGVPIDSPTSGGQLFKQINEVDELIFMVEKPGGVVEEVQVPLDD
jgi:type II secretory pathway component PulC